MKDKKSITFTNAFRKSLDESGHKSNKIRVEKGSELYSRSVNSWLHQNDIEMHSRFIRTLKNKIYKCMTSTSKNPYIDKLDHIVRTIKMNPIDVKSSIYIDIIIEILNLKLIIM